MSIQCKIKADFPIIGGKKRDEKKLNNFFKKENGTLESSNLIFTDEEIDT